MLGLAQTGTGKTAAFALPILERIVARGARPKVHPRSVAAPTALIVAPTRELASQIHDEFKRLGKFTPMVSAVIFGGVGQPGQVRELSRHPDVVVACPGRLLDLIEQGLISLNAVETLVLDEADHMFDMGFLPSIRRIVAKLPKRRQSLFFSATMPRELRKLADDLLTNPTVCELAHSRPPETIEHALYSVDEPAKLGLLRDLLSGSDFRSAIVFLRTKHRAKRLAQQLEKLGHRAVALQGNLSQAQRERAMGGFRDGTFEILVATDIAARGIDVEKVSHVVNYDLPTTPEAYTHRIGRTGRSECTGRAYSFATPSDGDMVRAIEKHLGSKLPRADRSSVQISAAGPSPVADFSRPAQPPRGGRGARSGQGGSRGASKGASSKVTSGAKPTAGRRGAKASPERSPSRGRSADAWDSVPTRRTNESRRATQAKTPARSQSSPKPEAPRGPASNFGAGL